MKKHSIISIIILFGLLIAFSGCTEQPVEQVVLGLDGVEISFEQGMPPNSIDKDEPFDIGVLVDNKGTAKVEQGNAAVHISGILPQSYSIEGKEMTYADMKEPTKVGLIGAYIENGKTIPGDADVIQWIGLEYLPDITTGKYPASITATSCYKYSTVARAPICLAKRSTIRDATGKPICEMSGDKPVTNDAAPVQVTKVTEYPYGSNGFKVIIEVQNVNNGDVYDSDKGTDCLDLPRKNQDRIYIDEIRLGIERLTTCSGWITSEVTKDNVEVEDSILITGGEYAGMIGKVAVLPTHSKIRVNIAEMDIGATIPLENVKKRPYIKLRDGEVKDFTCWKAGAAGSGIAQESMIIKLSYGYTETISTSMDINAIV